MLTFVGQGYRGEVDRDEIALVEFQNERPDSAKNQEAVSLASTKVWTTAVEVDPQWITDDFNELPAGVWAALQEERQATALRCCRQHPKAVAWSLVLFFTVVMEAYDKSLISGFMAFPAFQRRYGAPIGSPKESREEQRYEISAAWQMGLQNAALACEIIGLLAHGYITYVTGYRKMLILCLLWLTIAIFPSVFATSIGTLAVGQALCGLPWGVIQTLAATYAAEVVPSTLRACVLSNVNMCWLIGQFAAMGVLRILVRDNSQWSYRIPFAMQWAFVLPLLIGVYFCPDSPWWLIRHERQADARRALQRLVNQDHLNIDDTVMVMAGFDPTHSLSLSTGMYGMGILGGVISWGLLSFVGRRRLYLCGLFFALIFLVVGGVSAIALTSTGVVNWILGGLIIAMTFTYNVAIGPVCYVLVAEIPSTRLRVKTVALARVAYNICIMINNLLAPQMLSPSGWNLKGKVCFVVKGPFLSGVGYPI
ncbi:hypothetical protein IL306_002189 [Fusarium sp. DS 682]|nr:hypothetical protein IL306_002189 [Fusarium sp. DS 682]